MLPAATAAAAAQGVRCGQCWRPLTVIVTVFRIVNSSAGFDVVISETYSERVCAVRSVLKVSVCIVAVFRVVSCTVAVTATITMPVCL